MTRFTTTALSGVLAALPVLFATPALADCDFDAAGDLICDGAVVITDPVDEDIDGLNVAVEAGTTIEVGSDDAVRLRGDDNTLVNDGDIAATGGGDEGVQADGDGFTLINTGSILALDKGVQAEGTGNLRVQHRRYLLGR